MGDLFSFEPAAYPGKTDTSKDAAAKVLPKTGTQRRRVYDYLVWRRDFGATDEQIQQYLGISASSERPRRKELQEMNLIKDSGERRLNDAGNSMIVWVVA